jgi:hypothetical protein
MFRAALPGNRIPISPCFARRRPHRKRSFSFTVTSIRAYRAVAWQRIDKIRYSINVSKIYLQLPENKSYIIKEINKTEGIGYMTLQVSAPRAYIQKVINCF